MKWYKSFDNDLVMPDLGLILDSTYVWSTRKGCATDAKWFRILDSDYRKTNMFVNTSDYAEAVFTEGDIVGSTPSLSGIYARIEDFVNKTPNYKKEELFIHPGWIMGKPTKEGLRERSTRVCEDLGLSSILLNSRGNEVVIVGNSGKMYFNSEYTTLDNVHVVNTEYAPGNEWNSKTGTIFDLKKMINIGSFLNAFIREDRPLEELREWDGYKPVIK